MFYEMIGEQSVCRTGKTRDYSEWRLQSGFKILLALSVEDLPQIIAGTGQGMINAPDLRDFPFIRVIRDMWRRHAPPWGQP